MDAERHHRSYHFLEILADPVIVTDLDGKIMFVNSAFEKITGFRREYVLNRHPVEVGLLEPEIGERLKGEIIPKVLSEGTLRNLEITAKNSKGRNIYGILSFSLLKSPSGNPEGILIVVKDLSEKMEVDKAKRRTEKILRVLGKVNEEILKGEYVKPILEKVCEILVREGGYDYVQFVCADGTNVAFPVTSEIPPPDVELGRESVRVRDVIFKDGAAYFPMTYRDEVHGFMYVRSRETFSSQELRFLKRISENLSYAIAMLKEREEKKKLMDLYETMIENTGTAIVVVDDNRKVLFANREAERIIGLSREEMIGRDWIEFVSESERKRVLRYHRLRRIDSSLVPKNYEMTVKNCRGEEKHLIVNVTLIPNTKNSVASFIDVTKVREIEKRLSESEERYRTLFNEVPVGIVVTGLDMTILDCNKFALDLFKMEKEDVIGKKWTELGVVSDENLFYVLNLFYTGLKREHTVAELKVNAGREEKWVEVTSILLKKDGEPYAFLSMVRDITDRVERGREMERRLKQLDILHSIDMGVIKGERLDKVLTSALKNLRDVVDFDYAGVLIFTENGESVVAYPDLGVKLSRDLVREMVGKRSGTGEVCMVGNLLSTGDLAMLEIEMMKKGLKSYIGAPLKARGEEIGFLILASRGDISREDISFIRNLTSQLAIVLHEAILFEQRKVALERIEDNIEKFAILVDHIRNPLAAIYGIATTMVEDVKVEDMLVEQVERILKTVKKLDEGWLKSEEIRDFLKRH